jgi:hypothetical protein
MIGLPVAKQQDAGAPASPWTRRGTIVAWILAASPVAFATALALHAIHVRVYLGRWPIVYRDNPSSLLLNVHEYGLLVPTLYVALLGIPLWFLLSVVLALCGSRPRRASAWQALLIVGAVVALVLFGKCDPTGYWEWFLD